MNFDETPKERRRTHAPSESFDSVRTYALAVNCLDFGRFLAGAAREKSSNCVSPICKTGYVDAPILDLRFWLVSQTLAELPSKKHLQAAALAAQRAAN